MIYKVGDLVQFWVVEINHAERAVRLDRSNHWVNEAYVELAPLPDPLAALKDAVVATSLAGHMAAKIEYGPNYTWGEWKAHVTACEALIEAQRPPSKYAALRKAINNASGLLQTHGDIFTARTLGDELAKFEAQERNNAL